MKYVLTIILLGSLLTFQAFAQSAGPQVPNTPNSSTQNCPNGICSFAGQNYLNESSYNFTKQEYPVGLYPNGIYSNHSFLISLQESQACGKMLKLHIPNHCIPYDKVKIFDNTNPIWAGQWVNDSGYYHRLPPKILNHYKFNSNTFVVMADPNPDFTAMSRNIILNDGNFTWINPDESSPQGLTLISHINRSVLNCDTATVAPNLWLINDTIKYLESGCTKTAYNDTKITYQKQIPWQYNNPYSSLRQLDYLKSIYHAGYQRTNETGGNGLGNCIIHKCNYKDPYSKW